MKKVLFISLLLVSVFLICSSGVALAQCTNYQDYTCTEMDIYYGQFDGMYTDCLELCYDDGFEVDFINGGGYFEGYLYPAPDNRHLLGTMYDYISYDWSGCSIEFKGKTMIAKFSLIEEGDGYVLKYNCKQCNDCCH